MVRRPVIHACMTVLIAVCVLVIASMAASHDVWSTTEQDRHGKVYALVHHGHPGDRKNSDADKLFQLSLEGNRGPSRALLSGIKQTFHGGLLVLKTAPLALAGETGIVILAAKYDNGYLVKTPEGHRHTSRRQIPHAEDSLYSMKYAKALVLAGSETTDRYQRRLGHRLELVPLRNPFTMSRGETVAVAVYFDGKPLPGVEVEVGDGVTPTEEKDTPQYRTDQRSIAVVPITRRGPHLFVVDHLESSIQPGLAARELYNATLSFMLP